MSSMNTSEGGKSPDMSQFASMLGPMLSSLNKPAETQVSDTISITESED